jgi:hypothetical protein
VSGALTTSDNQDSPRGAGYYVDAISLTATASVTVTIEVTSMSLTWLESSSFTSNDSYLFLMNSNCIELARADDGGVGYLSSITYTLPYADTYTVFVSAYLADYVGSYTVTISAS